MSAPGGPAGDGRARRRSAERGSAIIEFIGVSTLVLVPVIYLVLTLADLQAGLFSVESAARETGRILATVGSPGAAPDASATDTTTESTADATTESTADATTESTAGPRETWAQARARAQRAADLIAADHGLPAATLDIACSADPCLTPGATLTVLAAVDVPLPLVPDVVAARLGTVVTVRAQHLVRVDAHSEVRP